MNLFESIPFLFKNKLKIFLSVLIGGTLLFVYSQFIAVPEYSATAVLNISKIDISSGKDVSYQDMIFISDLIKTYSYLLTSDSSLNQVNQITGMSVPIEKLREKISISGEENTGIMMIRVYDQNPENVAKIANAVSTVAIQKKMLYDSSYQFSLVNNAQTPVFPDSPDVLKLTLLGAVFGLIISTFILIVVYFKDDRVRTEKILKSCSKSRVLSLIPNSAKASVLNYGEKNDYEHNKSISDEQLEAFNMLRTALLNEDGKNHFKVIGMISGYAREGRSTVCANLAITLAKQGFRILLIDSDFRNPALHCLLKLPMEPGLSDLLHAAANRALNVKQNYSTDQFSFDVITIGKRVEDLPEILINLKKVLTSEKEYYDYILVDTPAIFLHADGMILADLADGVITVANAFKTKIQDFVRLNEKLEESDIRVIGTVLNRAGD